MFFVSMQMNERPEGSCFDNLQQDDGSISKLFFQ